MRLHHLTISAFGPFPGTEEIDFAELNDAGVFLLTGPTGAGKSSVLDAICFAIYGVVPGARGARTLKSHHAPPAAKPEVRLDFSVSGRRFVVRRSPAWLRPKKRGSEGWTEEPTAVTLVETTTGEEHFRSARAAEVGLLLGDLVGMNAAQYQQVAMLPQGEFQTFLRATTEERHKVLQHLFRTERFTRIEEWVQDRSRRLREAAAQDEALVRRLLGNIADRAGVALPESWAADGLAVAAGSSEVLTWSEQRRALAQADRAAASGLSDLRAALVVQCRQAHDKALADHALSARRGQAAADLAALAAEADAESAAAEALARSAAAGSCLPVVRLVEEAAAAAATGRATLTAALDALDLSDEDPDAAVLGDLVAAAQEQRARLVALLPRAEAAKAAAVALATALADDQALRPALAAAEERARRLPQECDTLRDRVTELTNLAARVDGLRADSDGASARLTAARALPAAQSEVDVLRSAAQAAREVALDAHQEFLQVVERRLAGMAAELAGRLAEGTPCAVCGSTDHPRPAEAAPEAVSEAEQEAAAASHAQCREAADAAAARLSAGEAELASLAHATGGLNVAEAEDQLTALTRALAEAVAAAESLAPAERELAEALAELGQVNDELTGLRVRLAEVNEAARSQRALAEQARAEVSAALGPQSSGADLSAVIARLDQQIAGLTSAGSAAAAWERSVAEHQRILGEGERLATDAGFQGCAHVRAHLLEPRILAELEALVRDHAERRAAATAVLAEPDILAVEDVDPPDLDGLRLALEAGNLAADEAAREAHLAAERAATLERHVAALRVALDRWLPALTDYLTADSMARLVRGTGHDNQLQMRLSSYVLATRLDQVLAAANERLAQMRDQRYSLARTGKAHRKGAQAGLGLLVRDEWTGEERDPATLSGGETFVVSLSLALGLADVVTMEAGGARIDTLFIDEGFGMLDAETLDDVMDRLDGLRASGRTVGVVSHVAELRNRIPTQLHVDKGRSGSTVQVRTLIA